MANERPFRDAALVLLGHGTTKNAASAAPVLRQVATLRATGEFARVEAAFWKQPPFAPDVLAGLRERRVFIVPLFATAGWFAGEVIPARLSFPPATIDGLVRHRRHDDGRVWVYTAPVGTHPSMTDLLLDLARTTYADAPASIRPAPGETALLLVGHGTGRSGRSRAGVEEQAAALRQRGGFAEVHTAYLEESPRVSEWPGLTRRHSVVVLPFFISDGRHGAEDVPVLLGASESEVRARLARGEPPWRNPTRCHGHEVWYAGSLGSVPELAGLILDLVRAAARDYAP